MKKIRGRKTREIKLVGWEDPPVSDVVYGKDSRRPSEACTLLICPFEKGRYESTLPVMTMNDMGLEEKGFSQQQCGVTEKGKTL